MLARIRPTGAGGKTFVIGGAQIYRLALDLPATQRILLTRIKSPAFDCDTFFPDILEADWQRAPYDELAEYVGVEVPEGAQEEKGVTYEFQLLKRR